MPPANDFHLCGGGFHAPGTALQHGLQQVPAGVGHQFQQGLVDRGKGYFRVGGGLAIGQLHLDGHLGLAAHGVTLFVGLDAHVELVGLGAHADLGHTEAEGGLAQIHQRGWRDVFTPLVPERGPPLAWRLVAPGEEAVPRHLAQPAAHGQHADIDIGSPAVLDLQVDSWVLAVELHHVGLNDAFALHGHQCGGKSERHAHLKFGGLARLVAFLLGQQVNAVVVFATKPQLTLFGDVDARGRLDAVARRVLGSDHQFHFTGFGKTGFTQQQAARIALAAAHAAEFFDVGLVVVGVEATHHALAGGGDDARGGLDFQCNISLWLARQVQRQSLKLDFLGTRYPTLGLDAGHHSGRPQGLGAADRLNFPIRVGVGRFEQQVLRRAAGGNLIDGHFARAALVQREWQLVGNDAGVRTGLGFLVAIGAIFAAAARALETEFGIVGVAQGLATHQR